MAHTGQGSGTPVYAPGFHPIEDPTRQNSPREEIPPVVDQAQDQNHAQNIVQEPLAAHAYQTQMPRHPPMPPNYPYGYYPGMPPYQGPAPYANPYAPPMAAPQGFPNMVGGGQKFMAPLP